MVKEIVERGERTLITFTNDASMEELASRVDAEIMEKILRGMGDFNSQMIFLTEDYQKYIEPVLFR